MTHLLSQVSQSSLGETCAFYLDYIAGNVPPSLRSLQHKFVTNTLAPHPHWIADLRHVFAADQHRATLVVVTLLLASAIAAVVIMSWRSRFTNLWPSRSPYPHVSESDYSYISPDQIVEPPSRAYDDQDNEPDTLLLKHRKNTYELRFPAYAINDGVLSVGQLRQRAAEVTHAPDPKRIKLLYKGKLLGDDSLPCRSEGLKQDSEVFCVVSEVRPGESTPSDLSDAEVEKSAVGGDASETPEKRKRNRNRNKNKKGKGKNKDKRTGEPGPVPPAVDQPKPSSSGMPPPAPNLKALPTAIEQVSALAGYFYTELAPLCEAYIASPPTEQKARDFEHKKLSETIMAQVLLKADGIEPDGQEDTRNARKALIKETQSVLSRLDQAEKS
ncbi:hypothetical protein P170DRAFT_224773 [Aspergillus steynii IBT 23096]|uniref:BAG domain protein n=1 Tax=Aspergillus steynii IBT 23096 TaxID=1392250 RepID=A0A2I2G1U1_9EURO|nr:uncharacterized protein P170DRAFT_224773 [Aspergillus steynii IBT 23096]PLB46842.1 hypothetical protein P170DRAFT_224773 [Aspergillus steynii IBT 23096]